MIQHSTQLISAIESVPLVHRNDPVTVTYTRRYLRVRAMGQRSIPDDRVYVQKCPGHADARPWFEQF